jgi:endogenous inhibitor of DNA gyrase (YacG/DUF329 family)
MIDLDNWLSGRYRISTSTSDREGEAEEQHPAAAPEANID